MQLMNRKADASVGSVAEQLTPKEIVAELDKYIVGQAKAKKAVAIAIRSRFRRSRVGEHLRDEIIPKNILMIGPTGVGKTEVARRMARLIKAPFIKVEASKFTEVGYVGRDVDSIVRDLTEIAVRTVRNEKMEELTEKLRDRAIWRIVDVLQPKPSIAPEERLYAQLQTEEYDGKDTAEDIEDNTEEEKETEQSHSTISYEAEQGTINFQQRFDQLTRVRQKLFERIKAGLMDNEKIKVRVPETQPRFMQVFTSQGLEELGMNLQEMFSDLGAVRRVEREVSIAEARRIFLEEEVSKEIDQEKVIREAIERVEEAGIVFIDEIDKIAGSVKYTTGPDVSREGVQRDLLPLVEGTTVITKYGPVRTNHILFIAAGAFNVSKPTDLIPEFQGRFPIRVEFDSLSAQDFERILVEPENSLTKQYKELLAVDGVSLRFTEDGIKAMAELAEKANNLLENIGARRLYTIMEKVLEDVSFHAPMDSPVEIIVDRAFVESQVGEILAEKELAEYIL